ncbi:uncharacterized protein [Diadema setosum]|uniref:uncharacterized protein n=1 Tax=Diadema setosum TaxID=31175 RepID=UPI003B3A8926
METRKGKATSTEEIIQAFGEYIQSPDFLKAIEEAVEKAMNKQMTKFVQRLDLIEQKCTSLKEKSDQHDGCIFDLEASLKAKDAEIKCLTTALDDQATAVNNLKLTMNEAEQYSRLNSLKFHGVKESRLHVEDTDQLIRHLCSDQLDVPITLNDLDRSHRVAPRNDIATSQPSNFVASNKQKDNKEDHP